MHEQLMAAIVADRLREAERARLVRQVRAGAIENATLGLVRSVLHRLHARTIAAWREFRVDRAVEATIIQPCEDVLARR
jgi:hypothetical protein